jgi:copper transport protein
MRRLVLLGLAVVLALPAAALAHATLRSVYPAFGSELRAGPRVVTLRFDQTVQLPAIQVLDSRGRNYALAARATGTRVSARVRPLPRGGYTIRWHALSADSHVVSGVWTFGVGVAAPAPTDAYGAAGPSRTEHVVRWLYFVALALVIGTLGFRLWCLRGLALPRRVEKRLYALAGLGVAGVLELGILAFSLRCEDVLQLPFGKFLYGDLSPISGGTRYGTAFIAMTLGFALVAALVFLAWLTDRVALLVPALLVSLGFSSGLSLSGHSAVDAGSSWLSQLADWVHLSAASLWIGGLVAMVVAVWGVAPELRRAAFLRFSRLATGLVGLVLAAGTYLGIVRLPQLSDLWSESYGRVLLVKLGLVAVVLAWGAAHHFLVRPALVGASDGFLARVGRSLAGESAVGIAVLLAAAVLTDSKPPPRPQPSSAASSAAYAGADGASSWRK